MPTQDFFSEQKEQSEVKTAIITKYLPAWTRIMFKRARRDKVAYIDLFAGPGQFKDGTKSTPLIVLEMAIQDADMREKLITIFNDKDSEAAKSLEQAIHSLPRVDKLKYAPEVFNFEIGDEIADMFNKRHMVPTLLFVDPWGYKGWLYTDLWG
jgi:three-Cys-motif partner protein